MSGITLITPTGGRPEAFELCLKYVERQDWTEDVQWVVVDDCEKKTVVPEMFARLQAKRWNIVYPTPPWRKGQNTLARNILAALDHIAHDKILFIEDDDWYAPDYFSVMSALLDSRPIAGCQHSLYYHVPSRCSLEISHPDRASLCQTGIRREALGILKRVCESSADYVDVRLWELMTSRVFLGAPRVVGMKGLPGRPGIGVGHRPEAAYNLQWKEDSSLYFLKLLIGEDEKLYRPFFGSVA